MIERSEFFSPQGFEQAAAAAFVSFAAVKEGRYNKKRPALRSFRSAAQRFCSSLSTFHFPLSTSRAAAFAALWVATAAAAWAQPAADWFIETAAGPGSFSGDGGPAAAAWFRSPADVAVDAAGNLYIADRENRRVRKVDAASGKIATVAGNGGCCYSGDGGPAAAAQLWNPQSVALDAAGNLYIADRNNQRIRKVDTTGVITTVAGSGTSGYSGDGGPAAAAQLWNPQSVALDAAGNLYIADRNNQRIRKVDTAGVITTVAGSGTSGFGGDGGPAAAARLRNPRSVAVDGAGNLYIADQDNHRIRKVDAAGVIDTAAGTGEQGFSGDNGAATAAQLRSPQGVAVDAAGNLYIADSGNHRIRKVNAAGVISTVAGRFSGFRGDGGAPDQAWLNSPLGVAADGAGNLYIADTNNQRVRKIDFETTGAIATVAGSGQPGDGGPALQARLNFPSGAAADAAGNLYIADREHHRVRKIDAMGAITTVAGSGESGFDGDGGPALQARLNSPSGAAVDAAGNLYIADRNNQRIRKVDAAGVISTAAGSGAGGFAGDGGPAEEARLSFPVGVALDSAGNLYIADRNNQRIRKVDAAGIISTVAGNGTAGFGGDGGPALQARLNFPSGVAADGAGNLYIADRNNRRVRRVDAAGVISTVAGNGTAGFSGDGGPALQARLNNPQGVALDSAGNLYIVDTSNQRIRKVDTAGVISTAAGSGQQGYGGDGGPALQARLRFPVGVALDGEDNLYIADTSNHRIRKVTPPPPAGTPVISSGGVVLATGAPTVESISPNAIVSVFGRDFAPEGTQAASPALDATGRIAANLAAACLEIDGKRAPLFAVFPTQINAQAPHDLTPGLVPAAVIRNCGAENEQRGPAVTAAAVAVSPAFFNFSLDPAGRNPIVALHGGGPALAGAPGAVPGVELTPAEPGEYVTLYGTGFGATEPALETGQIPGAAALLAGAVTFALGGIEVPAEDVLYAGAAPCCAGLYQFTVRVPADIPDGDASVVAAVQGVATPEGPFLAVRRQ